jgi:hypothetical protein
VFDHLTRDEAVMLKQKILFHEQRFGDDLVGAKREQFVIRPAVFVCIRNLLTQPSPANTTPCYNPIFIPAFPNVFTQ